jgi:hypothetical protein
MIELPHPQQPPAPPDGGNRRGPVLVAVAAVLVVVLVVALVNGQRRDKAAQPPDRAALTPVPSAPRSPGSTPPDGGGAELLPAVACPEIRDEQSRLAYRCIDNGLRQGESDTYLGLRISLNQEVEPGWVISEGSGNPRSLVSPPSNDVIVFEQARRAAGPVPTAGQVATEVRRRVQLALERAYGDNPASRRLAERTKSFGGVLGFELVTEITINPAYRARRNLTARTERLWTVGLPTRAGVSIFMLSIPDNRADLWPKAEATVATVRVL